MQSLTLATCPYCSTQIQLQLSWHHAHQTRSLLVPEVLKKNIKNEKKLKIIKTFSFYICTFKCKCNQGKAFKNKRKRLKKYSYIHIHKYMAAVHSRKILWRNNLGQWDLSEGHSSLFDFLVSLTEMRHQLLEDKEIHLSTRADLLPGLKKMKLQTIYF